MKLATLDEAIEAFVPHGASVAMGMALESLIPFAAGHAMIRHARRDLELIGPISDMLFDQLIGAGCGTPPACSPRTRAYCTLARLSPTWLSCMCNAPMSRGTRTAGATSACRAKRASRRG